MESQTLAAGVEHVGVLLAMMRELQADDPWAEPFDEERVRADLAALLANPGFGAVYIAGPGDEPVGYLILCFDYSLEYRGKGAWVDELFVKPEHRGKGIGTQLLDLAELKSRELGAQALHLEVNHGNRAMELYRRRGFVDHQRYLLTKRLTY